MSPEKLPPAAPSLARARARAREDAPEAPENPVPSQEAWPPIGHNSGNVPQVSADTLMRGLDRLDVLDDQISRLNQEKSAVFRDLKSRGFDLLAVRRVHKERKWDPLVRQKRETQFSLYWNALSDMEGGGQ